VCPTGGAVIAVRATGVCRSDWHAWMGHDAGVRLPHVPGHEFAGVVAEVGAGVRRWQPGDRVTVPFVCACGDCPPCHAGDHQVCLNQYQPGFDGWGSYAERVAVRNVDLNAVGLPADMDFVTAAGLGCRFSTAYRGVVVQGRLQPGQWVAVHGCGGVGLAAVMIAKAYGARVVAVDVAPAALAAAARLGADTAIGADAAVADTVRELTGGGADLSVEAFGSAQSAANSIRCLRPRGRHVQIGLLPATDGTAIPMATVIARELEVVGSHGMSAAAFGPLLADIASGRLDPAALIGRRIRLDEAPAALAAMSSGSGTGATTVVEL
jgi:alcohol dehydrogenase